MKRKIKRRCACGCGSITKAGNRYIFGHHKKKHGLAYHSLYKTWGMMKQIDNDGNYTPSNCKWSTRKEQNNNRRHGNKNRPNNIWITYKGETLILAEWSEKIGINYRTLIKRFNNNWNVNKIFSTINFKTGRKLQ